MLLTLCFSRKEEELRRQEEEEARRAEELREQEQRALLARTQFLMTKVSEREDVERYPVCSSPTRVLKTTFF